MDDVSFDDIWELYYIDMIETYRATREIPPDLTEITLNQIEGRFSDFGTILMELAEDPEWATRPAEEQEAEVQRRLRHG